MPSRYGFDPWTDLGILLQQSVPSGEDFEPWAFKVKGPKKTKYAKLEGIECVRQALLDAGYEGDELQVAFGDLSRGRWAPSAETLATMATVKERT